MAHLWVAKSAVGPSSNDDTASDMAAITVFCNVCIIFFFLMIMLHSSGFAELLVHSLLYVLHLISKVYLRSFLSAQT